MAVAILGFQPDMQPLEVWGFLGLVGFIGCLKFRVYVFFCRVFIGLIGFMI